MTCRHIWTQQHPDKLERGYLCVTCGNQRVACVACYAGRPCHRRAHDPWTWSCQACLNDTRQHLDTLTGAWHTARHRLDTLGVESCQLDGSGTGNGSMLGGDLLVWTQTTGHVTETAGMPDIGPAPVPLFAWLKAWAQTLTVNCSLTYPRAVIEGDQWDGPSFSGLAIWLRLHLDHATRHPMIWTVLPDQIRHTTTQLVSYLGLDDQPHQANHPCPECHTGTPQRDQGETRWTCRHCHETWPDDRALKAAVDTTALQLAETMPLTGDITNLAADPKVDILVVGGDAYLPWDGDDNITVKKRWPWLDRKLLNQWVHRRQVATRPGLRRIYYRVLDIERRLFSLDPDTPN